MAATRKKSIEPTEPLGVGALAATHLLSRIARLSHHAEGELALALQNLSRAILGSGAGLETLAFVAIDARLPVTEEAAPAHKNKCEHNQSYRDSQHACSLH
ncbi:hypothetical protein [Methylocella silvestris]|uniref:Uncharacterized protein n=1 Tax=Methylocella silvestris TaxID=199596 RepID=A0A2J7TJT1_METSI|nr:hypothetical protein [Methylocella silvestris]PNG27025.1 hypothetical protein CR492_04795 [Methylocella silvestris]